MIKPNLGAFSALRSGQDTAEQAARWFLRLQDDSANSQTFVEWQQWLNAARENRAAYEGIEDTVLRLERLDRLPELPSAQEMLRDDYDGSESIEGWKKKGLTRTGNWRRNALAAGVAAVALMGGWLWTQHAREMKFGDFAYQTQAGERQKVTLPDGSEVTLDANSSLKAKMSSEGRALTLERGEAYFQVAKDVARPFVVRAGNAQVTALGTAFNVRMSDNRTVVAVTEGKVEFIALPTKVAGEEPLNTVLSHKGKASKDTRPRMAAQLGAGEAISYRDDGNMQALPAQEAPLATAWLEGRRQYRNEPLRYVLADVDRYTGQRITLADENTGELRFTGTLNLENSEAWLRGLSVALPVKISRQKDGALSVESAR